MEINKIHQGNSLELIKDVPDKSICLTITSPPYNLGKTHHTGNNRFKSYDVFSDDLPEEEYQRQQILLLNEVFRATKEEGSMMYNHKNRIKNGRQITPYEWLLKSDWVVKQEIVWFNGSQNFDKIRFYPMTERIYWLAKRSDTKLFNAINHHDVFRTDEWKAVGTSEKHKRSFPEQMVSDLIKCFPESDLIFDPYMGSGTVGKAALLEGKRYLGFEISPEYCEIAQNRINEVAYLI